MREPGRREGGVAPPSARQGKRVRYAHPLDAQEPLGYIPAGVGKPKIPNPHGSKPKNVPNPGYVPGGLQVGDLFYGGGEAFTPDDLALAADVLGEDQAAEILGMMHEDEGRALQDFTGKFTHPHKGHLPRGISSPIDPQARLEPQGNRIPDSVRQFLSPGEEAAADQDVSRFLDVFNRSADVQDFATGAKLGRAKRGWYKDAADSLVNLFGAKAPSFAALLAATSPVKSVAANLQNALAIWKAWNDYQADMLEQRGRRPSVGEVERWIETGLKPAVKGKGYTIQAELPNILRALTLSEPGGQHRLSGPKVDSFRPNILGDLEPVTNDTYMAAFAGILQTDLDSQDIDDYYGRRAGFGAGYAAISAKTRMAAAELNKKLRPGQTPWTPAEVQETAWSVFRALAYLQGNSRLQARRDKGLSDEDRAREVLDPIQALDRLTHQTVENNADFATLLYQCVTSPKGKTQKQLGRNIERLGLTEAVARLAQVSAEAGEGEPPLTGRVARSLGQRDRAAAERIARRAAMKSGSFDSPKAQYRRRRYAAASEENLSFADAYARGQSADASLFKDYADQMTRSVGLEGTSYTGVGDWEDGAEQSVLTEIPQATDLDTLRYIGAWQGLTGNQRAVLVFSPSSSAKDSLYQIQVPETDAAKVREQLSSAGIPYRTIVPGKDGTRVVIYDRRRKLRDNVARFAEGYNAVIRETIGHGDYVGGGTRSDARSKYRQVIADYEARKGRRGQVPPR